MSKTIVSIFLSVVFLLFIAAPTILLIADDTIDISVAFSISEEEEKGNENHLDIEVLFSAEKKTNESNLGFVSAKNNVGYYYKKHPKLHLNLISPPP